MPPLVRRFRRPRPTRLALALLALLGGVGAPVPAGAQEQPPAVASLVAQSPWNGPDRPLHLRFRVTNRSRETLTDLSVVLNVHAPTRGRSFYELSLREDATPPIYALPFPQPGALAPGQSRVFRIEQPLDVLAARGETALYPLKVQVLAGDRAVATLRSALIFLAEPPSVPLNLAWTWVLAAPLQYGPSGAFFPGPLESEIARGGTLRAMAGALQRLGPAAVDVVVSPVLVDQLQRMAGGYAVAGAARSEVLPGTGGAADAARVLDLLRAVARRPSTELAALPHGDASIPALLRAGLGPDADLLLERGRRVVQEALGRAPEAGVFLPLDSELDAPTLRALARHGVRALLVAADLVPPLDDSMLSPSPVVRLAAGETRMTAVRPDPGVAAIASSLRADPRLAAQAALGGLAAIWLELPGTPGRGAALLLPDGPSLPPGFYPRFVSLVRRSPWLRSVPASRLPSVLAPGAPERRPLPSRTYPTFSPLYVEDLLKARTSLDQFARTAPRAAGVAARLRDGLLLALSRTSLDDPAFGRRFIDAAAATIRRTYRGVGISSAPVTLASRSGLIPVTVTNEAGTPLVVRIRLIADRRIAFPRGSSRRVTLPEGTRTFTFPVTAQTTGRFPIKVQVRTLGSDEAADTIAETHLVVRSTAYNRVALFLTIGAALFLFGWWGRRFLPRREARRS